MAFLVLQVLFASVVTGACLVTLVCHFCTGVPPVSSTDAEACEVVRLLRDHGLAAGRGPVYELGCGWGALLVALGRAFPDVRVVGFEVSPVPWLVARIRTRRLSNVEVRWRSYRRAPIGDAAAVTAYLMMRPMITLLPKFDVELQPGTPVVVVAFLFRGRAPQMVADGDGVRKATVALYEWPGRSG